jgi:hypothetical protein
LAIHIMTDRLAFFVDPLFESSFFPVLDFPVSFLAAPFFVTPCLPGEGYSGLSDLLSVLVRVLFKLGHALVRGVATVRGLVCEHRGGPPRPTGTSTTRRCSRRSPLPDPEPIQASIASDAGARGTPNRGWLACRRTKLRMPSAVSSAGTRCGSGPSIKRRLRRLMCRLCARFEGLSSFTSSICVGVGGCTTMCGRAWILLEHVLRVLPTRSA